MFERILVPLDGSDYAEIALPLAVELAAAFASEVHLVSVCETILPEHRNMHRAYIEQRAEKVLAQMRDRRQEKAGYATVKSALLEGDAATEVLDYAEKSDVGLLIVVSHGRSGVLPWPMGSTASRILAREARPVLFVHAQGPAAPRASPFGHIMVPLDGSPNSEVVLPYVQETASRMASQVSLFRTVLPGYQVPTIGGLAYVSKPQIELDRLSDEAKQYLGDVASRSGLARAKPVVCIGDAGQEIIKFAGEEDVSLIALSALGQTGAHGWNLGAVAHKVLHSGKTPMLLVKTESARGNPRGA